MIPAVIPWFVVLVTAAAMSFGLAIYSWRFRRAPAARPFIGLAFCTGLYAMGYALELASVSLDHMLIWNKFQYFGISFLPAFWILLAAAYSGKDAWVTKTVTWGLLLLSGMTLVMDLTNSLHHFYYAKVALDASGPFPVIALTKGPWYWIHVAYMNLCFVAGTILLIGTYARSSAPYRKQTAAMMVGASFPWVAFFVYILGLTPYRLDATPFALAVTGPIFAWGLYRYRIFDIVPVAKESVFASMRDGAIVVDVYERVVDFNSAAALIFPRLSSSSIGRPLQEALPDSPDLAGLLKKPAPRAEVDFRIERGGRESYFRARVSPVFSRKSRPKGSVLLISDVSEYVWFNEQLKALATIDDLTSVFNRRHFLELGRKEVDRAKRYNNPLSLMIIDLDHFKSINDLWGHETGDEVLRAVCDSLQAVMRSTDHLGRHGGEEFAVLLPETARAGAFLVADRLRATVGDNPVRLKDGKKISITASVGVADLEGTAGDTFNDLMREADRAMYEAKSAGRNCVR